MSFKPDPAKQGKEVICFKKMIIPGTYPSLFFNNSLIDRTQNSKILWWDKQISFW